MSTTANHQERLRVLFLLPFSPRLDALHGGGRVMAQLLAAISARHQVGLLYMRAPEEPTADDFFANHCDLIEAIPRLWTGISPRQRLIRNSRMVFSLIRKQPMWVTDWENKLFYERVRQVALSWGPDIVQIEYHVMGQYLSALDGLSIPRVLTEYEPGVLAAPYLKGIPTFAANFVHNIDRISWLNFEPSIIRQVQATVVFTAQDARALERFGLPVPVHIIPFGTNIPEHPLNPLGSSPLNLLFVGNFIHSPNIEAALWLASEIFPRLAERFPELLLFIVGDQPPPELQRLAGERIVVTGRVPDLTPYVDGASLFVAPIRSGGGMRVKIMESLAAGKAVVTTRLAIEGLAVTDGEEVVLAESSDAFEQRIACLLTDSVRRAALAARARSWACQNLGWDNAIAQYDEIYRVLLGGSKK